MDEALRQREPSPLDPEDRLVGHPDIVDRQARVIGGHVEGPQILPNFKACRFRGGHETADARGAAILASVSREHQHMAGLM